MMKLSRARLLVLRALLATLTLAGATATGGCDDDPVAYSETVSTKLSGLKPGDLVNGTASEEKNINTESGNPYGAFLKTARDRLGGRDPSSIEPTSITLRVSSDSKNVIAVEQVLADVEVFFANGQTTIPVARRSGPTGSSITIPLLPDVDYEPLAASMLAGDFKVGARGNAIASPPDDFDLKLTLDIRFRAFE